MITGFHHSDLHVIQTELRTNRQLLQKLGDFSHVTIETPLLQRMIQLAESAGAAAKTSGAGGGDCGIVLIDQTIDPRPLLTFYQILKQFIDEPDSLAGLVFRF